MYTTKTKSMKMMFKKLPSPFKHLNLGMLVNTNNPIDLRVIRNVKDCIVLFRLVIYTLV